MNEEQTNPSTKEAAPAKPVEKWYESRQIQAAVITGVVSLVINLLNILVQKIR